MANKYIVEVWHKTYGVDGKSLKEVVFSSFDFALSYANGLDYPCTIWRDTIRVMDIG